MTFLSGLVSNIQITVIFYQPSHTDIQKDINIEMWDRERGKVSGAFYIGGSSASRRSVLDSSHRTT